jgi:hypothetical protein
MRLSVRAEVQRGMPFDAFSIAKKGLAHVGRSWKCMIVRAVVLSLVTCLIRAMFLPGHPVPVPDLVKVAGLAKSFEPVIYYSERGIGQIHEVHGEAIAVWDLGESVRSANMPSSMPIVEGLTDMADNLNILAMDMVDFFASVDGDVDGSVFHFEAKSKSNVIQDPQCNGLGLT